MTLETYFKVIRVMAGLAIATTGLLISIQQPGNLDIWNGAAVGLVIYALWRA